MDLQAHVKLGWALPLCLGQRFPNFSDHVPPYTKPTFPIPPTANTPKNEIHLTYNNIINNKIIVIIIMHIDMHPHNIHT